MHIRLAFLAAVLSSASFGCATPADEPAAKQGTADQRQSGTYRTGSRLPSYDSDGSSSTGTASKDDYADDMRRVINPSSGR